MIMSKVLSAIVATLSWPARARAQVLISGVDIGIGRGAPLFPLPTLFLCRLYAVVVELGEDAIGPLEQAVKLPWWRAPRLRDRLLERAHELGIADPDRFVAQVGEIGAKRRELVDCGSGVDLLAGGALGGSCALALAAAAEKPGPELDLEIGVDDLLAGAHVLGAPEIALDQIDELVVEIAVVDRGDQRQGRNEHRKEGDRHRAQIALGRSHRCASSERLGRRIERRGDVLEAKRNSILNRQR